MKKPEKKKVIGLRPEAGNHFYNYACDDWEAFLPSEEEILKLIVKTFNEKLKDDEMTPDFLEHFVRSGTIAKAISKRLWGEK